MKKKGSTNFKLLTHVEYIKTVATIKKKWNEKCQGGIHGKTKFENAYTVFSWAIV